ncbi:MAG: hypothetical protein KIS73_24705 [Enhydrobacter sp.]|nr:hypothetical protein [Enhydrobacter sp.]
MHIKVDVPPIVAAAELMLGLGRQVPFATARALTLTVRDAQTDIRAELPKRFTIRNSWVSKGIRIDPATKTKLEAAVGTLEPFMRLQETGGAGHARDASRKAVPKGAKRGKSGIIPKGQRPRALLNKPKHFLAKTRFGAAVMKRKGKARYPIEPLFWLKRTVPIKPRFGFKGQVETTTGRRFAANWATSMDAAAASSRP